jgi:hypothetical protein
MGVAVPLRAVDRELTVEGLTAFLCDSVQRARAATAPFFHLEFDRVVPDAVYQEMLQAMPVAADYRPMSGRSKDTIREGRATRVKTDLLPEYIRRLPASKRPVWTLAGRALRARALQRAFVERLAPGLERRFGPDYARVGFYPMPILTRDTAGYSISPHTDTKWKGITVQFYLPPDLTAVHVGTVFHGTNADGSLTRHSQMRFAPNTGYAFAVGDDSWHSVDVVGPEVATRDSILLTYFVDAGALRFVRNRLKRAGNAVRHEWRQIVRS